MNHDDVQLIGVFSRADDPDPKEGFTYTRNAPTNLWVGALCTDGSRMGFDFMAYVLNELIDADCFEEGKFVLIDNQGGATLMASVGPEVPVDEAHQAYQSDKPTVRVVTVEVLTRAKVTQP